MENKLARVLSRDSLFLWPTRSLGMQPQAARGGEVNGSQNQHTLVIPARTYLGDSSCMANRVMFLLFPLYPYLVHLPK